MAEEAALVFDCGSTNLRVAAVSRGGRIITQASQPNAPVPQPSGKSDWLIWDVDDIWHKLCLLCRRVKRRIPDRFKIVAVTVTTWGADGALVRRDGSLAYPAISWQCPRTREMALNFSKMVDPWEVFKVTGYQVISFNTLLKLMWIKSHIPEVFKEAYTWLMMPGLIAFKLTGRFHIDPTSGSTMMAMDLAKRDWSSEMLAFAGLDPGFFPSWMEPGEVLGHLTEEASRSTGLKRGLPVIVGGHDTQFAILASGVGEDEAVLSSGTWEILALRLGRYQANRSAYEGGILIEADVQPGLWNPQLLMIASAVLEWIREMFYPELKPGEYEIMIEEAKNTPPLSEGVVLIPSFVSDSGPTRKYKTRGTMLGLTLHTGRGHIYRAALEGLSCQLKMAIEILEEAFRFKMSSVRIVGGGSRNSLWNRIRADVTSLPITITGFTEATVLGAALTCFKGIGVYRSLEEALKAVDWDLKTFKPSDRCSEYVRLYESYKMLLPILKLHYESYG